jgi:hypothetical protein
MAVVDLRIDSREPFADGQEFGEVGAYERIDGEITFAVDPGNAANQAIVDLALAPRDRDGRVRFRADVSLLLPRDPGRGNRRLLVDLVNRGRKLTGRLNRAPGPESASRAGHPGDGFLFHRGWSVASIGWQWDVLRDGALLGLEAPPVLVDGLPASDQNIVEIRPNFPQRTFLLANRNHQPYPVARLDDPAAALHVRDYEDGPDSIVPRQQWQFARETVDGEAVPSREHIFMKAGFEPGKCYHLVYEATDARVVGAGLLAFRDVAAFLRRPSPLNPAPQGFVRSYGFGVSQTGRMLRHFLYLGLNLDEEGRQVYDGLLVHVAGGRRGEFNHRFAQPSVQSTPGFGHLFPFADDDAEDPFNGRSDGLLKRQRQLGGVPRVIYTNTSAEYWRGDGALAHIDASGQRDLESAQETRIYHFAGTQHVAGALPQTYRDPNEGTRSRYGFNVVDYIPLLRAALVNLDRWASEGVEPPPGQHPTLADETLTEPAEVLSTIGALPDLHPPDPARLWRLREMDLGPDAERGIGRYPVAEGRAYPALVPAVDADGNELSGVRLPDLTVPIGTHAGWNPRHPDTGAPEQIIPMMGFTRFFPATRAGRERTADPRPSIEERYASRDAYLALVHNEAVKLAEQRYILEEDVDLVVANAADRYDLALSESKGPAPS